MRLIMIFAALTATSGIAQVATRFKTHVKFAVFLKTLFTKTQTLREIPNNKAAVETKEVIVKPKKSGPLVPEPKNAELKLFKAESELDAKTEIRFEIICTMKLKAKITSQVSFLLCAAFVTVLIALFVSIPLNRSMVSVIKTANGLGVVAATGCATGLGATGCCTGASGAAAVTGCCIGDSGAAVATG